MTRAWRGTSRRRLYDELGWDALSHRRWYRRLCHFVKLIRSQSPEYLLSEIPPVRQIMYNLRNPWVFDPNIAWTVRFSNTYFQNTLHEWNLLDDEMKNSRSISEFKWKLLQIIKPVKNSMYNISDIHGVRYLTKMWFNLSALHECKFRHKFDCFNPRCTYGEVVEIINTFSCTARSLRRCGGISLVNFPTFPGLRLRRWIQNPYANCYCLAATT